MFMCSTFNILKSILSYKYAEIRVLIIYLKILYINIVTKIIVLLKYQMKIFKTLCCELRVSQKNPSNL